VHLECAKPDALELVLSRGRTGPFERHWGRDHERLRSPLRKSPNAASLLRVARCLAGFVDAVCARSLCPDKAWSGWNCESVEFWAHITKTGVETHRESNLMAQPIVLRLNDVDKVPFLSCSRKTRQVLSLQQCLGRSRTGCALITLFS